MAEQLWAIRWTYPGWSQDGKVVAMASREEAEETDRLFKPDSFEVIPWPGTMEGHAFELAEKKRRAYEYRLRERGYLPDGTRIVARTDHVLTHPWPEDCYVQGGKSGLVFAEGGDDYTTAFVEAFPRDPATFLRGEGETVAEAEDACWRKYLVARDCVPGEGYPDGRFGPHGPFERRRHTNGYGFCVRCGTGYSEAFEPLPDDPDRVPSLAERLFTELGKAIEHG